MDQAQRPNLAQMQRDARELATLARSIPPDIDLTAKGLLAKQLRGEISR